MIALNFKNIDELKDMHYKAILSHVNAHLTPKDIASLYANVITLPGFEGYPAKYNAKTDNYTWLKEFILADFNTLKKWVAICATKLRFQQFKTIYLTKFSNGYDNFVDTENTYNAYVLLEKMDISVCPYCEHEFFEIVEIDDVKRRTCEFDHFFPKGDANYPALAMCFYNLVPSCIPCNRLKKTRSVTASPYSSDIEKQSFLYPDLEIGVNMETVKQEDCCVQFHAMGDMVVNEKTLALEQRYAHLAPNIYHLLKKRQQYPEEKLEEMERLGINTKDQLLLDFFGNPREKAKGKELHTKLKQDLIGY